MYNGYDIELEQNSIYIGRFKNIDEKESYHYELMNNKYKNYISQYSKSYIEMSVYYYGPKLPFEVYCTFKCAHTDCKRCENYSLFLFFGLFQMYTLKI